MEHRRAYAMQTGKPYGNGGRATLHSAPVGMDRSGRPHQSTGQSTTMQCIHNFLQCWVVMPNKNNKVTTSTSVTF